VNPEEEKRDMRWSHSFLKFTTQTLYYYQYSVCVLIYHNALIDTISNSIISTKMTKKRKFGSHGGPVNPEEEKPDPNAPQIYYTDTLSLLV